MKAASIHPESLLLLAMFTALFCQSGQVHAAEARRQFALLVGVTRYPSLTESRWLQGPANDVDLMRRLLREKFGFSDANIFTLKEGPDPAMLPTRANIQRELDALTNKAGAGDAVVVFLSGHGSLQPHAVRGGGISDLFDNLFLPRDIGPWNGKMQSVTNALADREVSDWAKELAGKGASLWLIVDSCHSGGLASTPRGAERTREISPEELGMPKEVADKVHTGVTSERGGGLAAPDAGYSVATDSPLVAATYACRSRELTVEKSLPSLSDKPYGLFTYTLGMVLTRASGKLTYRELVRQINTEYSGMGRYMPIPLAEGLGRDRDVLGAEVRAPDIRLSRDNGELRIDSGRLEGLNAGSILAVYPPPGRPDAEKLIGYVSVTDASTLAASVKPVPYKDVPAPPVAALAGDSVCQPVYIDFGIEPLAVCLNPSALEAAGKSGLDSQARVRFVAKPDDADFVVSFDRADAAPAGRLIFTEQSSSRTFVASGGTSLPAAFSVTLGRIARARALLKVAGAAPALTGAGERPNVGLKLYRHRSRDDFDGEPVDDANGAVLHDGDLISFKMTNNGDMPLDLTLLFVDSGYGIDPIFPRPGTDGDNRVGGKSAGRPFRETDILRITSRTTIGPEQVVLVAVKAHGPPADFSFLAQPTLARARGQGDNPALQTSLAQLLLTAEFGIGDTRGLSDIPYRIQTLKWETRPAAASQPPRD